MKEKDGFEILLERIEERVRTVVKNTQGLDAKLSAVENDVKETKDIVRKYFGERIA
jgi:hypothetical protein